jgi:predicted RNase H-like HicB family nuclease
MEGDAKINIQAEVHEEPDGTFWAKVTEPESLAGVFATGDTFDELFESLREGIELCLEAMGDGLKSHARPVATGLALAV